MPTTTRGPGSRCGPCACRKSAARRRRPRSPTRLERSSTASTTRSFTNTPISRLTTPGVATPRARCIGSSGRWRIRRCCIAGSSSRGSSTGAEQARVSGRLRARSRAGRRAPARPSRGARRLMSWRAPRSSAATPDARPARLPAARAAAARPGGAQARADPVSRRLRGHAGQGVGGPGHRLPNPVRRRRSPDHHPRRG